MKRQIRDSVVIVTGASRGIGRAISIAFAERGARLVLVARSHDALAEVETEIRSRGADALVAPCDVGAPGAVASVFDAALRRFGRIDVLVNNAGIGRVGAVAEAGFDSDVDATLHASLFGMIAMTRAVLPVLEAQREGSVVNMSSVMGRKAFARFGSYAAVMHAVAGFSDALRQEVAPLGLHVSVIHPALTATDLLREVDEAEMPAPFRHMTPLAPEQVATAVVQAVERGRKRVILPSVANMMLLGDALSPRLGDLIAAALTVKPIAWALGVSRGRTYHQAIGAAKALTSRGSSRKTRAREGLMPARADAIASVPHQTSYPS